MLIAYLKQNRESVVIRPLFTLRAQIKKVWGAIGLEHPAYWVHERVSGIAATIKPVQDTQGIRADFERHHVLIVHDIIPADIIDRIRDSMADNIQRQNILTRDALINKKPTWYRKIWDKYFNNVILFYNFPESHFTQISSIVNPLKNVNFLKEQIESRLLPTVNELMGSPAEVLRAWAYRTNNFGGKLTPNHNGRMHLDGDRHVSIKCLVYVNDVTEKNGPFSYRDPISGEEINVLGKAGTAVFFKSSLLWHRGTNTVENERYCFSFLACPAFTNKFPDADLRPDYVMKTVPFLPTTAKVRLN